MLKKVLSIFLMCTLAFVVASCGSKEEKKAKFFNRGQALYEKGDFVKAALEFKNALQIDPKYADAYYMLGRVDMKNKEIKRAYARFSKAVELDPDLLAAQVQLARIFMAARADDRARETIERVLAKAPRNNGARLVQAALLLREKKKADAGAILETLYREGETAPELYLALAATYHRQKDAAKIEALLVEGVEKNKEAMNLRLVLAALYLKRDQTEAAATILKENVDLQPDVISHRLALADFYWKTDQRGKTRETLDELAVLAPDRETHTIVAAQFYLQKKEVGLAEQMLRDGIAGTPKSFKLREALSDLFVARKNPDEAMAILEDSLTLSRDPADPGILTAKTKMARIHIMRRESDRAEALIDAVLKENAKSVDANFVKGHLHLAAGRGADAVTSFRTVVAEQPENIKGHLMLAQAHLMNDENALAIDALNQGVRKNPGAKALRRALVRIYMAQKDTSAAEEQLVKITQLDPKDIRAGGDLGDFKLFLGRIDEAREHYEKMVADAPAVPAGYLKLAGLFEKEARHNEAIAILEKGYAQIPDSMPILAALVKAYANGGQLDQAKKRCDQKIAAYPDNAFTYNLLAQVELSGKKPDAAEESLKKAIVLSPQWNVPHDNLVRLYLSQGKTGQAMGNLKKAIAQNAQNTGAFMTLALLHEKNGEHDQAKAVYEQALETDPRRWAAANNLAFLLAEYSQDAVDLERAIQLAEQAEKVKPEEPTILDTMGWVYYKQGNHEMAVATFEKALEKHPENGVINYHLARVLVDDNRLVEARQRLETALADDGGFRERTDAEALLKKIRGT